MGKLVRPLDFFLDYHVTRLIIIALADYYPSEAILRKNETRKLGSWRNNDKSPPPALKYEKYHERENSASGVLLGGGNFQQASGLWIFWAALSILIARSINVGELAVTPPKDARACSSPDLRKSRREKPEPNRLSQQSASLLSVPHLHSGTVLRNWMKGDDASGNHVSAMNETTQQSVSQSPGNVKEAAVTSVTQSLANRPSGLSVGKLVFLVPS